MDKKTQSAGHSIVRAMFVVIFFYSFWKFGGFLLNVFIGSVFPSGNESDAYLLAYSSVIFLIYGIVLKFFMPAFVPLFMETKDKEGEDAAWQFAGGTINLLTIGLVVVAVAGVIFAPQIMWTVGQGFFRDADDPRAAMTVSWVRIMFPGLVGMCIGIFTYGLLNSYKIFSYPAAGDACQKIFWALSLFVMVAVMGRRGVAIPIGYLIGIVAQILVNFLGLRSKLHFYRPTALIVSVRRMATELAILAAFLAAFLGLVYGVPAVHGNSKVLLLVFVAVASAHLLFFWLRVRKKTSLIGRFAALATPLLIGILLAKARDVLTDNFTTEAALRGLLSDRKFAEKVGQLPSVVVGYALAIAMLPYLCDMAAKKSVKALGDVVDGAWRMIALFFIPLSVIIAALATGIMQLVYDRGNWSAQHLDYGGFALMVYISGLFFYAVENVLMYSFFSLQRTWLPTIAGFIGSIFHVIFLFACDAMFNLTGPDAGPGAVDRLFLVVILSFPLSRAFKNILLFGLLKWQIPMLRAVPTIKFMAKLAVISIVIWFATRFSSNLVRRVVKPDNIKGRQVTIDLFKEEKAVENWRAGTQTRIRVENIRKADEEPELALRVDGPVDVTRDLAGFDLSKTDLVTFKIKSDGDLRLEIILKSGESTSSAFKSITATTERVKVEIPVSGFLSQSGKKLSGLEGVSALAFRAEAGAPVWLDNVEFTKHFPPATWAMFEIAKIVAVGVPALIGFVILIAGAFALRIEEMSLIYTWLREEGLNKIKKRLKGGGGDAQAPSAPDS